MTITTRKGLYVVTCNRCPTEEETQYRSCQHMNQTGDQFGQVVEMLKRAGWFLKRIGYKWLHYCPKCAAIMPDAQKVFEKHKAQQPYVDNE